MNIRRYIEEDYDGCVIKIPSAIIMLNPQLEEPLKKLAAILDSDKLLSKFHPDIQNSIFEIEEYAGKKDKIESDKKRSEDSLKRRQEYDQKLLNYEIIETVIKTEHDVAFHERVIFSFLDGSEARLEYEDIITNKGNIKASADKYLEDVYSKIDFGIFFNQNGLAHGSEVIQNSNKKRADEICEIINVTGFSRDNYDNVRVIMNVLNVKCYKKDKKGRMCWFEFPISFTDDDKLFVKSPRTDYPHIDLTKYEFRNSKFYLIKEENK